MGEVHHFAGLTFGEGAFGDLGAEPQIQPEGRDWQVLIHIPGTEFPTSESVDFALGGGDLAGPPSGLGSQTLRILDGRLESQPYTIRVADPDGALTARLFAAGRLTIIGRWAEVRTRLDGGPWQRVDARRISRAASPDPISWEFELTSDAGLLQEILFARSSDIQLLPLGPAAAWNRHPAAGVTNPSDVLAPGQVLAVDGDFVRIRLLPQPVPREMLGVVADELGGLRMEVGGADRPVRSFGATPTPGDVDDALGLWLGDPPRIPTGAWVSWPAHGLIVGQNVGPFRLWWPGGVPTSAVTPRLIGPAIDRLTGEVQGVGLTLDALVRDVLDGVYGGRRMAFDAAAVAELATLGDEGHWFVIEAPISRGEFLRRHVWRAYVVAPSASGDGTLRPRHVWAGDAVPTTGKFRFRAVNTGTPGAFEAGGSEIANLWQLDAKHADLRLPAEGAVLPRLDLSDVTRVRRLAGTLAPEEPYQLPLAAQVMRRVWTSAVEGLYAERVFALAGDGAVSYRLAGAVTDDAPLPGDVVVLDMADLLGPHAQSGSRSGSRLAVVIERTRSYGADTLQYDYLLWDAGARAHSVAHVDDAHADTHSDSEVQGHFDAHVDEHIDQHVDGAHSDSHSDADHVDQHSDGAHADEHGDSAGHTDFHVDSFHADSHGDIQHSDNHIDGGHIDSHGDETRREEGGHCDVALFVGPICFHDDTHGDTDSHGDSHSDIEHDDQHVDEPHDDQHADIQHSDAHGDGTHADAHADLTHGDSHSDLSHQDEHADLTHTDRHADGSHGDAHGDAGHTDWHDDGAHQDTHADLGHQDQHTDSEHTDTHDDTAPHQDDHDDVAHQDSHGDGAHLDTHDDVAGDPEHADIHQDADHDDAHSDTVHADSHSDSSHSDTHTDVSHNDQHSDFAGFRETAEDPHCDDTLLTGVACHQDSHSDVAHSDVPHTDSAHSDIHGDAAHSDTHGDEPHFDDHTDIPEHQDSHGDAAHNDAHGDVIHADHHEDVAHQDGHADGGHSDTHTDSDHTDDHADSEHSDAHRDQEHADVHGDLSNHGDASA